MYKNPLYVPNREQASLVAFPYIVSADVITEFPSLKVLLPAHHISNMSFWSEVYTSSFGNQNLTNSMTATTSSTTVAVASTNGVETTIETPSTNDVTSSEPRTPMTKTRSYGDLQTAGTNEHGLTRRSSDPNMTIDAQ